MNYFRRTVFIAETIEMPKMTLSTEDFYFERRYGYDYQIARRKEIRRVLDGYYSMHNASYEQIMEAYTESKQYEW